MKEYEKVKLLIGTSIAMNITITIGFISELNIDGFVIAALGVFVYMIGEYLYRYIEDKISKLIKDKE